MTRGTVPDDGSGGRRLGNTALVMIRPMRRRPSWVDAILSHWRSVSTSNRVRCVAATIVALGLLWSAWVQIASDAGAGAGAAEVAASSPGVWNEKTRAERPTAAIPAARGGLLVDEVRSLRQAMDALRADLARSGQVSATTLEDLSKRIGLLERAPAAELARIAQRVALVEEQIRLAAAPRDGGSIAPIDLPPASALPPSAAAKKQAGPKILSGWTLRRVSRGIAVVEGRNRLIEVVPGQTIPGAGRVISIRRRGGDWIVVTNRGIITGDQW